MATRISAPVGAWDDTVVKENKGNRKSDVKTIQILLNNASTKLKNSSLDAGIPDGLVSRNSSRSSTLKAIGEFQKQFLRKPDFRVDPDGRTIEKLQIYAAPQSTKRIAIDGSKLSEFINAMMDGHCRYGWGSKASPLTIEPAKVKRLDCSGFVQYLLYTATDGRVKLRAGSWHQNEYFSTNGYEQVDYSTNGAKSDGVLRLGYFAGTGGGAGHIWFVLNGETIESHGGKGPNRRAWSTSVLKSRVKRCYVIGKVTSSATTPTRPGQVGRTMLA